MAGYINPERGLRQRGCIRLECAVAIIRGQENNREMLKAWGRLPARIRR